MFWCPGLLWCDVPSVLPGTSHVAKAMSTLNIQVSSLSLHVLLAVLLRACNMA